MKKTIKLIDILYKKIFQNKYLRDCIYKYIRPHSQPRYNDVEWLKEKLLLDKDEYGSLCINNKSASFISSLEITLFKQVFYKYQDSFPKGYPPITKWAAHYNNLPVLEHLIELGYTPDEATMDNACRVGNLEMVQFLYRKADMREIDFLNLESAVMSGNLDLVVFLMGILQTFPMQQKIRLLEKSAALLHADIFRYLNARFEYSVPVSRDTFATIRNREILELCFPAQVITTFSNTALQELCICLMKGNHIDCINYLLSCPSDTVEQEIRKSVILLSLHLGKLDLFQMFDKADVDLSFITLAQIHGCLLTTEQELCYFIEKRKVVVDSIACLHFVQDEYQNLCRYLFNLPEYLIVGKNEIVCKNTKTDISIQLIRKAITTNSILIFETIKSKGFIKPNGDIDTIVDWSEFGKSNHYIKIFEIISNMLSPTQNELLKILEKSASTQSFDNLEIFKIVYQKLSNTEINNILNLACENNRIDIIKYLLSAGCRVDGLELPFGTTSNYEIIKLLFNNGCKRITNNIKLMSCVKKGYVNNFDFYFKNIKSFGSSLNGVNLQEMLYQAISHQRLYILKYLFENFNHQFEPTTEILKQLGSCSSVAIVKYFHLNQRVLTKKPRFQISFKKAIKMGDLEIAKYLNHHCNCTFTLELFLKCVKQRHSHIMEYFKSQVDKQMILSITENQVTDYSFGNSYIFQRYLSHYKFTVMDSLSSKPSKTSLFFSTLFK
ncbi:hypothetical protein CYY_002274 [Polysphondylium violaceum]|uniref:Ankyrin repeat-containing protein n=1 Tax=Polysphondylium violaceum TaxID=133409 RepID=A0A8J4Q0G4_9MYCE|nr:hypothetical protein CYY_002274 [Polysphondylium violaceum]